MSELESLTELTHNRGPISDPAAFSQQAGAESWLYMCGQAEPLKAWVVQGLDELS